MILKELNLISFGKFQNKIISLEEGLNIIYGKNESGKTTIHNFIDGMFYGFLKPYAKIRNYSKELEKYRPWNGQDYSGIIKLSQFGKDYRIERNFEKGQVKVYDDLTGIDITKEIDMGEKLKDNLPGLYFFNFNNMVYNNTISIKQLESKIDTDLSKEFKDKLANISTSLDQDISVKNAIGELDKKLENIGTERAYTKPYGRAISNLNNLIEERKSLLEKKEEYNQQISASLELKKKIKREEEKLEELNNKLEQLEILDKKKTYEEGINIKSQLGNINREIINLKKYANLSFEDYALAVKLEKDIEYINKEIEELKNNINVLENRLKTIELEVEENIIDGINAEELYRDLDTLEEIDEEKNIIILNRDENKLDILNSELRDKTGKENTIKKFMNTFLVLAIVSIGLVFINKFFFLFPLGFGIIAFLFRNSSKNYLSKVKAIKEKIKELEAKEKEKNERIIYIENLQKNILLKYSCSSKLELKRLKEDIYFKHRSIQIKEEEIEKTKEKIENSILSLKAKEKEIQNYNLELNAMLEKNNSSNLEDFKLGLDKKKKYDELLKEKKNQEEILKRILGDYTLEEIKEGIKFLDNNDLIELDTISKLELTQDLENRKSNLQHYLDLHARFEERIDNLNQYIKQIIVTEEEIERLKNEIVNYENQIKSINIAKETIENISNELHQQFAPSINKDVSEIISIVSEGKYNEVKIDEDLNISIENPNTKEIIPVDSLSGGTIDQLYFALRFSIISSMKGESLPLVLDDCFIQYDDERLKNILEYLSEIAKDKQIILFTCHRREEKILNDLGLKYNLVNLSH